MEFFEAVKVVLKETVETSDITDVSNRDFVEHDEIKVINSEIEATYFNNALESNEVTELMKDSINLQSDIQDFGNPQLINEIRRDNDNVDAVLSKAEQVLNDNPSDLDLQKTEKNLERYKGTVFENELKNALRDNFDSIELKQKTIETDSGMTRPDIILRSAKEDIKISDLEINKNEDLFIESKAGTADYIRSEMPHILKQVEGHGENSLVMVTRDYLDIPQNTRIQFEQSLREKGSHLYIADIDAVQIDSGLISSLDLQGR